MSSASSSLVSDIHPTAVVAPEATIAAGVRIGPYCVVGPQVTLETGVHLHSHVVVEGHTTLGPQVQVFPFATVGVAPQDLKYAGETAYVAVGERTVIREHVTIHCGTQGGGLWTKVGADVLLMVGVHVAHDCQVGDRSILANGVTLAGHVITGTDVILGGLSAVHQFTHIGAHAMIGGMSGIDADVLPCTTVLGNRAHVAGLNIRGLKRRGFSVATIRTLQEAIYGLLQQDHAAQPIVDRIRALQARAEEEPALQLLCDFFQQRTHGRPLCRPTAEVLSSFSQTIDD